MEWIEAIKSHSDPDHDVSSVWCPTVHRLLSYVHLFVDQLENKAHADLIIRKAVEQRQKRVERLVAMSFNVCIVFDCLVCSGLSFSNRSRRSPARSVSGSRLKENGTRGERVCCFALRSN